MAEIPYSFAFRTLGAVGAATFALRGWPRVFEPVRPFAMEVDVPPEVTRLLGLAEAGDVDGFIAQLNDEPTIQIDARNDEGESALHLGCLYGHERIVRACLERGADVNAIDEDCSTPLHNACAGGFLEVVHTLVAAGAQLQATDSDGDTPLHHACNGNHAEVARFLTEQGASVTVTNRSGRTPPAVADDAEVRDACAQGAAAFLADPPAVGPAGRRILKAKRPVGTRGDNAEGERSGGEGGGSAVPDSEFMPPPPPRPPPGPTLSTIGRRPSCRDMAPVSAPASSGGVVPGAGMLDGLDGIELPPDVLQLILQDPDFASALSNHQLLGAMREVLAEPARLESVCAQSPELAGFLARIVALSNATK